MLNFEFISLAKAEELSDGEQKAENLKKKCRKGLIKGAFKSGNTWFIPKSFIVPPESALLKEGKVFRRSLLEYPGENLRVDYKSAEEFRADTSYSVKLVKHILGMANSGGGFLIIGMKEKNDRSFSIDDNLNPSISNSYDTNSLSQYVNKFIAGEEKINLVVYKEEFKGRNFPIIQIFSFEENPLFCKRDFSLGGKKILEENALYIHTPETRTVRTASPKEWKQIIDLCIEKKKKDFFQGFLGLVENTGLSVDKPTEKGIVGPKALDWFLKQEKKARSYMKGDKFEEAFLGFGHWLIDADFNWDITVLKQCAEESVLRRTGWPFGVFLHVDGKKPIALGDGIEAKIISDNFGNRKSFDYWFLDKKGSFYQARVFEEDTFYDRDKSENLIFFDTRIWRIAEALEHCVQLYKKLKVPKTTKVGLRIIHNDLRGRLLSASNSNRAFALRERKCGANRAVYTLEATLDEIEMKFAYYVKTITKDLLSYFDFFEISEDVIDEILDEYFSWRKQGSINSKKLSENRKV